MRHQMRKGLVVLAVVFTLMSCAERPVPEVVPNFAERKPLRLAVIPTVYFPLENRGVVNVKDPAYLEALMDQMNQRDPVLLRAEEEVRKRLQEKGYEVVHRDLTLGILADEGGRGLLNSEGICRRLGVDALMYVNLVQWDIRHPFARVVSPKPKLAAYGGESRPQTNFRSPQGGKSYKYHRVVLETAMINRFGEVLWRDRNFPDTIKARGRDRGEALTLVMKTASASALTTLPVVPGTQPE